MLLCNFSFFQRPFTYQVEKEKEISVLEEAGKKE